LELPSAHKRIEIELTFDQEFPCDKELSNKEFSFYIENLQATVAFPKINPKLNRDTFDALNCILLPPDNADLKITGNKKIAWGNVYSFPIDGMYVGSLRAWVIVLDENNYENEGNHLYDQLPRWRDLLQLYIEIFTRISLRHSLPNQIPLNRHIDLSIWKNKDGKIIKGNPFNKVPTITGNIGEKIPALDVQGFSYILNELKTLNPPPLEYQLLNEARIDYRNKNYGKAVMQASTALEIIIESIISEIIEEKVSKEFSKFVTSKQTLGKKYHALKALGIDLAAFGYLESFITIRNQTAHKGYVPERCDVNNIIKAVEKILEKYSPLK
jgi:hypothetical protein